MQIGFTGTRRGMTEHQLSAINSLLSVLCADGGHVHHGDCWGADTEFHELAREMGLRVEIHPPSNPKNRSYCDADILWPEYDYLVRNRHIVNHTDVLIAAPGEDHEVRRSGTWSTYRYARSLGRRIFVVYPSGVISEKTGKG